MDSKNEIIEGDILKQLLIFFFPILIGTFFQQLYNTVDSVIVGKFVGSHALAAVGGTGTLINLLVGFFVGLGSGATVIIAQYYGAKNLDKLSKSVHTGIALSLVSGLFMMITGLVISPFALKWINIPSDIFNLSLSYLRIFFLGMIPSLIYNIGAGILRAVGDSKRPQYYLMITCVINIILDCIFVIVLHLDVIGVAIATVLSQCISAILVLNALIHTTDIYQLTIQNIRFDVQCLKEIVRIGLPAGGQSVLYSSSNLLIQSSVNKFGTLSIAAWTAFGKIDSIIWMVLGAFGVAITTFVGQNYGAKLYDRVKTSVRIGLILCFITIGIISIGIYIFSSPLMTLFASESEVIYIGSKILRQLAPFYSAFCVVEIFSGAIKGSGEGFIPMVITCFCVCVFRFIWVLLIVPHFNEIYVVSLSYPITWILTAICFIVYYIYYAKKTFN